jgi:hypothetical protein
MRILGEITFTQFPAGYDDRADVEYGLSSHRTSAEEMMARRWSDLSPRSRKLIIAAAVAETGLKAAVLVDLRRRPAGQVRGSKRIWTAAMLVNSAGLIPLTYFLVGRRRNTAA